MRGFLYLMVMLRLLAAWVTLHQSTVTLATSTRAESPGVVQLKQGVASGWLGKERLSALSSLDIANRRAC